MPKACFPILPARPCLNADHHGCKSEAAAAVTDVGPTAQHYGSKHSWSSGHHGA